jgi:hypothetical protein
MSTPPSRSPLLLPALALGFLMALPAAFRLGDRIGGTLHPPRAFPAAAPIGPVQLLTQRNDNQRSGTNLREKSLTTDTVRPATFGKLFSRTVDGQIYAQPLYVSGLTMANDSKQRNVVFVATEHNSVYAFDADDPAAAEPLWQVNLGASVPIADIGQASYGPYRDFSDEVGITGTPVIDQATHTLYVIAKTRDAEAGKTRQHLHALDITSGHARLPPVEITASVPGSGIGSVNGRVAFNPHTANQRGALLLDHGVLYANWSAHADIQPYHGWVMAYDPRTLKQIDAWCTTPDGEGGGISMGGNGLAADREGHVYFASGDGTCSGPAGGRDWGDSYLKLRLDDGHLTLVDSFTPYNQADMDSLDRDLGSSGLVLSPGMEFLVSGSKAGFLYQVDSRNMGGYRPSDDDQILSRFLVTRGSIYGSPLCWNDPEQGMTVFVWGGYDCLKAFRTDSEGRLDPTPRARSTMSVPRGKPGGFLALSANGGEDGTAILWAAHPREGSANRMSVPGILRAFDARDISRELWNSEMVPERDSVGLFAKFCTPTIANGKVYLGTFSNRLNVYGLLPGASSDSGE